MTAVPFYFNRKLRKGSGVKVAEKSKVVRRMGLAFLCGKGKQMRILKCPAVGIGFVLKP